MSKRDVLDELMAQRFRWRALKPGDLDDIAEQPPAPPPAAAAARPPEGQAAAAERAHWERAARACADLARQVTRVWQITPRSRQAAATAVLLARAEGLGLDLVGMRDHPLEGVRLWRLVVRHHDKLPRRDRKAGVHALSFAPVSPDQREVVDLLVEAAEAGDGWLAFILEGSAADEGTGRRHPELGARLAQILDQGKTWAAREIAARWLSFAELRDAIPALQRALRRPHARTRWIALEILIERAPSALTEDDVLWLLEDAVRHPLPGGYGSRALDTAEGYGDALVTAVAKVTPAEGWRPLEIIAAGGGVHIRKERSGLDAGWALRALAAGYPERALARIDRALLGSQSWRHLAAVEAAGLLPDELARPRLLEAAAGPGHHAAERARALWFARFGGACPVDALTGVPAGILGAAPGERLLSRLMVLRGPSDEARGAMQEALLAEAPDPEALALLLFSLRALVFAHRRPGLPVNEEQWAERLLERFGAPAFEGLVALAARGARAGVDHGWLNALASLANKGALAPPERARLREIARDALGSPAWDGASAPLLALAWAGAPPDLLDRLWSIAMTPTADDALERSRHANAARWATIALVGMEGAPALDARIAAEGAEALGARSYPALERILDLGCRRATPAAFDLGARCLARVDDDPAAFDAALRVAYALEEAGRLDESGLLDALDRPESRRFAIAARLLRKQRSLAILGALHRALESEARGGAAAAEAAAALLVMEAIGAEDRRLDGILERAPPRARASLLGMLLSRGAPLSPLQRHFLDLLVCADAEAAESACEDLFSKESEGTRELFEAALALGSGGAASSRDGASGGQGGPSPSIREMIEHYLGEPSEAELYWRDGGDDDEDERESEEDFG